MTLYRCDRLHASITDRQCNINHNSGHISCVGCPGLGDAVSTFPLSAFQQEDEVMANVIGFCEQYQRDAVSKPSINSVCFRCYSHNKKTMQNPVEVMTVKYTEDGAPSLSELEPGHVEFVPDQPLLDDLQEPVRTIPKGDPLRRLLDTDGWLVEIPRETAQRLHDEEITPEDINELLWALVCGELRRVAL